MGMTEKLTQISDQATAKAKSGLVWSLLTTYQATISFAVGLTIGLVIQTLLGSGSWSLLFMTIVMTLVVFRLIRPLGFWGVTIFTLICVLTSLSLRLYIQVAPTL